MNNRCSCDYEPAKVYKPERIRARTAHTCDECGCTISPGETYEHVDALWAENNKWKMQRTCQSCLLVRDEVEAKLPCFCWAHHSMLDDVTDALDNLDLKPGVRFSILRLMVQHRAYRQIPPVIRR